MPPLRACGRRWEFASDDLVIPGSVLVGIRSIWLIIQIFGIGFYHSALSCGQSPSFASVAYASIAMTTCVLVLEVAIVIASSRGTIRNNRPRRFVPHLLHARLIIFAFEIIILLMKTVMAVRPEELNIDVDQCPTLGTAVIVARVVVAVTWLIFLTVLISVAIYLDPCHLYSSKVGSRETREEEGIQRSRSGSLLNRTRSVWEDRLKLIFCLSSSDESHQTAYKEVANIFAHLFHDSNLVLSDIAAGILLLQKRHLVHEKNLITLDTRDLTSVAFNFTDPEDKKLFSDALHYLNFALGTYTWSIHIFMNPTCGFCEVLSHAQLCRCCCCSSRKQVHKNIHKDNSCYCGYAGFLAMTGINQADIIYARFENDLYRTPFVVCLDHERESVVVAIRGTLSLQDVMTDLTATTHPLQLPGWSEFAVHRGMYNTALWIKEYLDNDQVLESAFEKVPRYRLVLSGHSLGSGVACILSILLKKSYPDLRCFCFSPTGSLLNAEAAIYTQSFVTSVTLGQDLVCRLNVNTAHQFTRRIIEVLESSKKPKHRILFEGFLETLGVCCGREIVFSEDSDPSSGLAETNIDESDNPSSPLLLSDSAPLSFTNEGFSSDEEPSTGVPPLYPPGKIIHIVDTLEERSCFFARRQLEATWSAASSFKEINVSPYMLKDHMPDVLYRAMESLWKEHRDDLDQVTIQL
ncbi:PREDICTED: sn1-specific diacylglycerol lipase beta-like [Amphimedon queenslandica]|uniref:sn-1-specific diacylglycerol lipase n=1 Tax=Amphimedon queenslandica TaxID=400682 RepID=A0A1X7VF54_AMPQE|nr:PREDICTED: sn1-specific diacylglycerol lipase beta-like [Amphimedon queenslandica]|eukprot:XP_003384478.1 PREDICTED: sn1-specific diacylglycerol lipase beta-like [Amphimedon queenslandica]